MRHARQPSPGPLLALLGTHVCHFIWPSRLPGLGMEPQRYHKILRRFLHPSRRANPYDDSNCLLRGSPRSGLSPVASRWLYSVRSCPLGAGTSIFVECEDCSAWRSRESVVQPLCWVLSILRCGLRAYCWAASSLRAIGHVLVQPLDRGSFDWNPDYRSSRHLHLIFLEPTSFDWLRFEVDPVCHSAALATPGDPTKGETSKSRYPLIDRTAFVLIAIISDESTNTRSLGSHSSGLSLRFFVSMSHRPGPFASLPFMIFRSFILTVPQR
jgi:hypothetical protein